MVGKIAVIGGDMRHGMLARLLRADGYSVDTWGTAEEYAGKDSIKSADELAAYSAVILPMPVTQDGVTVNTPLYKGEIRLDEVMSNVSADTVVLGGKLPPDVVRKFKWLSFYDYLEREDFAVKNAVATAEGAIALAINETPFTVWKSRCLVVGYGRIAKILIRMLKDMGARVDAAARKCADRAWIETLSCGAYDTSGIEEYIGDYDLIFNTVPQKLIDKNVLKKVKKNALIIDLASKPGGVGFVLDRETL